MAPGLARRPPFAFSLGLNFVLDGALGGYPPALVALIFFGLTTGPVSWSRLDSPRPPAVGSRQPGHMASRRDRQTGRGRWFLYAAGVFAVSLTLRTLDEPLCVAFPLGTHFLWHCLNATVLFIVAYTIIRQEQTSIR